MATLATKLHGKKKTSPLVWLQNKVLKNEFSTNTNIVIVQYVELELVEGNVNQASAKEGKCFNFQQIFLDTSCK